MGCVSTKSVISVEELEVRNSIAIIIEITEMKSKNLKQTEKELRYELRTIIRIGQNRKLKHLHNDLQYAIERIWKKYPELKVNLVYVSEIALRVLDPTSTISYMIDDYQYHNIILSSPQTTTIVADDSISSQYSGISDFNGTSSRTSSPKPLIVIPTANNKNNKQQTSTKVIHLISTQHNSSSPSHDSDYGFFDLSEHNVESP